MRFFTFAPYFYIDDESFEEFDVSPKEALDIMLDQAIDVIRYHFDEIGINGLGPNGADYYDLEPVLLDGDAKSVSIDLSHCSCSAPVSSYDIETIATALKMPSTSSVVIKCFGKEILIDKDIDCFFSYIVGEKRYRSPYDAAVYAVNHWHEFEDDTDQQ